MNTRLIIPIALVTAVAGFAAGALAAPDNPGKGVCDRLGQDATTETTEPDQQEPPTRAITFLICGTSDVAAGNFIWPMTDDDLDAMVALRAQVSNTDDDGSGGIVLHD